MHVDGFMFQFFAIGLHGFDSVLRVFYHAISPLQMSAHNHYGQGGTIRQIKQKQSPNAQQQTTLAYLRQSQHTMVRHWFQLFSKLNMFIVHIGYPH